MSELTLTVLRLGFLVLLWMLVLSIVAVLRRDLFGTQVTRRATPARSSGPPSGPRPSPAPSPQPPPAAGRGRWGRGRAPESTGGGSPRTLVVTEGSLRGTTIALGSAPILIGRAPECTLVLDDDYASGRHARFHLQGDTWMLEDLGSTNGTFIGRERVAAPLAISPGTPVRIGRTVLELRR